MHFQFNALSNWLHREGFKLSVYLCHKCHQIFALFPKYRSYGIPTTDVSTGSNSAMTSMETACSFGLLRNENPCKDKCQQECHYDYEAEHSFGQ